MRKISENYLSKADIIFIIYNVDTFSLKFTYIVLLDKVSFELEFWDD